jgi:hypothetical protein
MEQRERIQALTHLWTIDGAAAIIGTTLRLCPDDVQRSAYPADVTLIENARGGVLGPAQLLGSGIPHRVTILGFAEEAHRAAQQERWQDLQAAIGELQRYAADAINVLSEVP